MYIIYIYILTYWFLKNLQKIESRIPKYTCLCNLYDSAIMSLNSHEIIIDVDKSKSFHKSILVV